MTLRGRARGACIAVSCLAACGGNRLVTVPTGAQPAHAQPIAVDFPPPPAKIEEIPISHRSANGCVWRDGFWDWTGRRWEWQAGRAVLPPPHCHFAEAKLEWTADSLSFYRPAWYPDAADAPAPSSLNIAKACNEIACIPPTTSAPADAP